MFSSSQKKDKTDLFVCDYRKSFFFFFFFTKYAFLDSMQLITGTCILSQFSITACRTCIYWAHQTKELPLMFTSFMDSYFIHSYYHPDTIVLFIICLHIILWGDTEKGQATEEKIILLLAQQGWLGLRFIGLIVQPRRPSTGRLDLKHT